MPSNRRPRLLVLCSTFPARIDDGTPAFVLDLAREEARTHEVLVVTPMVPGAAARERLDDIEIRRFRYFPRWWEDVADGAILDNVRARRSRLLQVPTLIAAEFRAVRRAVRSFRPDVVHAHWVVPQGLVAAAAAPGVPLVVTAHGADAYALRSGPLVAAKRWALRRAVAVTAVNSDILERLVGWGARPESSSVIPMGVDVAATERAALGIDRDDHTIVVVGRLVEKKGLGVLIEALRDLRPPWRLVVIGDGPLRGELERAARGLPVTFAGQLGRSGVLSAMASAAIVALPSVEAGNGDQEGLPVTLLEAAALGAPVVASALTGIEEAVGPDRGALLVPPGDAAALRDALERLLDDPSKRERLGERARIAAARLGIDVVGAAYRDVLHGARGDR